MTSLLDTSSRLGSESSWTFTYRQWLSVVHGCIGLAEAGTRSTWQLVEDRPADAVGSNQKPESGVIVAPWS